MPQRLTGPLMLALALAAGAPASAAGSEPRRVYVLVTPAEAARELAEGRVAKAPPLRMPNPLAPQISVVQPVLGAPVANPIDVVVRFEPGPDAQIDRSSLKVRYGLLRIDVTDRLLNSASWDGNEIRSCGATVPRGSHRFIVQVADTRRRIAESEVRLVVR